MLTFHAIMPNMAIGRELFLHYPAKERGDTITNFFSIQQPNLLHITRDNTTYYGANQIWYPSTFQKNAGCGPTTGAHLIWYLSQTHTGCQTLCSYDGSKYEGFLHLMEDVWNFITPKSMGVNDTDIFSKGALRYGTHKGIELTCQTLKIPRISEARPTSKEMFRFLENAFTNDLPVAFLNLSNGTLTNLESWHWVTLISADSANHTVKMYNQGIAVEINLNQWLRTSLLGGGFVTIDKNQS